MPGRQGIAINPIVAAARRKGAKQGGPLIIVHDTADIMIFRQQEVILHVENSRGIVGPLDEGTKAQKPIALIAKHGAGGTAAEQLSTFLHPIQKGLQLAAPQFLMFTANQIEPCLVEGLP